jgi:hypothetical protein
MPQEVELESRLTLMEREPFAWLTAALLRRVQGPLGLLA